MASIYDFTAKSLAGKDVALKDFEGQVLLIVNTASECGFTPQYEGLEQLQQRYGGQGFTVLAFPCNQFGGQEPGDDAAIADFCATRFSVSFPLFSKVQVNGAQAAPLFTHLKQAAPGLLGTEAIKWNFTKFLVDRQGNVVARFDPNVEPETFASAIENLL